MGQRKEEEKTKRMTLMQWILRFADTNNYRAGKSTGWKHCSVDTDLLEAVGGIELLREQARKLEENPDLKGKIKIGWKVVKTDIEKIEFSMDIIPLLCKIEGTEDLRKGQIERIEQITHWKQEVIGVSWIQPYYDMLLMGLEKGKKMSETKDALRFRCLNAIVTQKNPFIL